MPAGVSVEPLDLLLEDVVAAMREGEVCRLSPIPRAVASHLSSPLPPETAISCTMTLTSFQRARPVWEMAASELLALARQHKEEGNRLFRSHRDKAASICYSRAARLAIAVPTDSEDKAAEELQLVLFLNLSACQLRMSHNNHAFDNCSRVLAVWPECVKARYRRGTAAMNMGDLGQAEEDLLRARGAEPANTAVQGKLRELEKMKHLQAARLRDALKPMFTS